MPTQLPNGHDEKLPFRVPFLRVLYANHIERRTPNVVAFKRKRKKSTEPPFERFSHFNATSFVSRLKIACYVWLPMQAFVL